MLQYFIFISFPVFDISCASKAVFGICCVLNAMFDIKLLCFDQCFSFYPDYSKKISAYRLVKPGGRSRGRLALLTICVKVLFSSNNFFISQPIYFVLTHIVA